MNSIFFKKIYAQKNIINARRPHREPSGVAKFSLFVVAFFVCIHGYLQPVQVLDSETASLRNTDIIIKRPLTNKWDFSVPLTVLSCARSAQRTKVNLSLISTFKTNKLTSMKVEINAMKLQEVNFQKSQKLLASRAGSSKQTIARTAFTQPAIEIEWIAIECFE